MRALALMFVVGGCKFTPGAFGQNDVDAATPSVDATADARDGQIAVDCLARWHAGTVQLAPAVAIPNVNDPTALDRDPFLTPDELTLYFSSGRATSMLNDIWTAHRTTIDDPFSTPTKVPSLSSPMNEGKLSMTDDGLYAVISSDHAGTVGLSDIWETTRPTLAMPFMPFDETNLAAVDTTGAEYDPWISGDGRDLYLAPVNPTDQYIAHATRGSATQPFGPPAELTELTSGTGDGDPTLAPDQTIIAFSSNRTGSGFADGNMWYAVRASSTAMFGTPVPIPGVNTDGNDGDPHLSHDGCRLYFARDHLGDLQYDLYVAAVQ